MFKQLRISLLTMITILALGQSLWLTAAYGAYATEHWAFRKQIAGKTSLQKYVQVELDGEIYRGSAAANLADLRIVSKSKAGGEDGGSQDGSGKEVPYYLYSEKTVEEKAYSPTILNKSFVPGAYSSFILDLGEANLPNNRMNIETPGTNFLRRVEVEGTDNPKGIWNKLSTNDHIFAFQSSRSTQLHYSENNFRYLRLKIWNKSEEPLDITGAQVYYTVASLGTEKKVEPKLISTEENGISASSAAEEGKKSTLLTFDLTYTNYPSHKLVLITDDQNFSRQVTLEGSNDQKNWIIASTDQTIYSYNIDHQVGKNLTLEYPEIAFRYLRVRIHDQDNPPLKIQGAVLYSFPRKVVFPCDPGVEYNLYYGNPKAGPPGYDIQQLAAYIKKDSLPGFSLGPEEKNPQYIQEKKPWTEENKWLLWFVLGLVVIVLGFSIINTMQKVGPKSGE